ncbi:hypothetical protein COLO4_15333 [Corchorus olitorius]|uniref:RNase H type-1 domain-containing protein n=1 Tax=Corchorus olitorius TaxID=93759 RepID=A0A1R3JNR9_9ROSI|nr:hypothetical protein COLO4_15333 [Corchorus olitorius]
MMPISTIQNQMLEGHLLKQKRLGKNISQQTPSKVGNLKTKEKRSEPWSPPQEGFVKINVDGAYESVSGAAAVGIVARDHHGTVLSGLGKRVRASSSEMVEVMAVREGLKLAKENEWNNVVLETDSKETFNGCTKEGCECAWEVKPLVQDIKV